MRNKMRISVSDLLPSRYYPLTGAITVTALAGAAALADWHWLFLAGAAGILSLIGARDFFQTRHAILRNYPLLAHFRFSSRPSGRKSVNICSRATMRRYRFLARNARSFISGPRTSRADSHSAPARTFICQVTNGSIIRCTRCTSTILISACASAANTANNLTPVRYSTSRQ